MMANSELRFYDFVENNSWLCVWVGVVRSLRGVRDSDPGGTATSICTSARIVDARISSATLNTDGARWDALRVKVAWVAERVCVRMRRHLRNGQLVGFCSSCRAKRSPSNAASSAGQPGCGSAAHVVLASMHAAATVRNVECGRAISSAERRADGGEKILVC